MKKFRCSSLPEFFWDFLYMRQSQKLPKLIVMATGIGLTEISVSGVWGDFGTRGLKDR